MVQVSTAIFTFIILFIGISTASSAEQDIRIALGEWPPYTSETLPHNGLLPLIIKKALAYSNKQVHFEFMDWDEAYNKTRSGNVDISPGWIKTPSREQEVLFSQALSFIDLRFVHNSSKSFSWDKLEETYSKRLGTVKGYSYGLKLDTAIKDGHIRTHQYQSDLATLKAIANNEVDIYPIDALVANYMMSQLTLEERQEITLDENTISSSPIFLIGNKQSSKEIIASFNDGLKQLINSGEYAKILENIHLVNKLSKLRFLTEDNAPTNYLSESGATGIMVSAISHILQEIGADTTNTSIEVLPWARAYRTLEQQEQTVLFALTKTEERSGKFKWVGPVYRSNIILIGLKERFTSDQPFSIDNAAHLNVCAVRNDVGEQLWLKLRASLDNLHRVSHPSQCAKMLSLGRVDLWASGKDTARWHIQKNQLDLEAFTEVHQLKEAFRYIAFSKDVDDEIISSFQKTLNYLKLSGKLTELINIELEKADAFAVQQASKAALSKKRF